MTTLPVCAGPTTGTWLTRRLRDALLKRIDALRGGRVTIVESGTGCVFEAGAPGELDVHVTVHDPAFYTAMALGGSIGASEAYAAGRWDVDDPARLVRLLVRNREVLDGFEGGLARLSKPLDKLVHLLRPNTRKGARSNIAAHYDLGNDFFELWLDDSMTYSAGVFERPGATLQEASVAKLDRLCRKLDLAPGMRVLEIGCGWGSMALHAAEHFGVHVTAVTLSEEQHARATERVRAAGLEHLVDVSLTDYRDLDGTFDRIVSVEMIEAVGAAGLDTYTAACSRLLAPDGLFGLQAITIADQHFARARDDVDFIKKHIFPGSFIPCITAILDSATRTGELRLTHLEDFGPHYARTLEAWRKNLKAVWPRCRDLGYGEDFLRLWEWYLAYCEGGFEERFLGVSQLVFAHPGYRGDALLPAREALARA